MANANLHRIDPDAALLELFSRWVAAERCLMTSLNDDNDERDPADAILEEIAATPSVGTSGFAVKAFCAVHIRRGGSSANPIMPAFFDSEEDIETMVDRAIVADTMKVLSGFIH